MDIVEVEEYTAAVPAVSTGDDVTPSLFTSFLQALANRTKWLKAKVDGLGTAATKNVGTVANTVAAGDHSHTGLVSSPSYVGYSLKATAQAGGNMTLSLPQADYLVVVDLLGFQGANAVVSLGAQINAVSRYLVQNSNVNYQVAFGGSLKFKVTNVANITITPIFTALDVLQCEVSVFKI